MNRTPTSRPGPRSVAPGRLWPSLPITTLSEGSRGGVYDYPGYSDRRIGSSRSSCCGNLGVPLVFSITCFAAISRRYSEGDRVRQPSRNACLKIVVTY